MDAGEVPADVLLRSPWVPVNIDGRRLLAKSRFEETSYSVLLTDLRGVWEERLGAAAIQARAEALNARLRATAEGFFSHLRAVAQPFLSGAGQPPAAAAHASVICLEGGDLTVKLKTKLAGVPFHWEFRCTPAPVTMVCAHLVRPLLAMSGLMQRQSQQLADLLLRKDAEIQDYKENGAALSRERLRTHVFEERTFREGFMAKTLPLVCSEPRDDLGLSGDLQELYATVVAHSNAGKRKLSEEEVHVDAGGPEDAPTSGGEPGNGSMEQTQAGEEEEPGAQTDQPLTTQECPSVPSSQPGRPSSKPKKKKRVGLFR